MIIVVMVAVAVVMMADLLYFIHIIILYGGFFYHFFSNETKKKKKKCQAFLSCILSLFHSPFFSLLSSSSSTSSMMMTLGSPLSSFVFGLFFLLLSNIFGHPSNIHIFSLSLSIYQYFDTVFLFLFFCWFNNQLFFVNVRFNLVQFSSFFFLLFICLFMLIKIFIKKQEN